jgi:hypothetical protein
MEKERNRNLMLYEFKCGYSAAAATQERNRCRIEDAGTVKESTCTIINENVILLKILKTKNKQNLRIYFTFNFTLNLTKGSSFFFALLNVQIGLINVLFVPFASVAYF